ncbi:hypothetical protein [Paenibacillus tyrfis]|uniref:Uncharacterized protein n=1 Tax=Paenibacillus tyrfis TaxID=1501230 RepID=A0A081NWN1_9BACL|nr:hypothetical protein [Paenibacillus tyrfis]KEQ22854.1 hypothetical protein ET33_21120 [Paenibacillus tyrfis]
MRRKKLKLNQERVQNWINDYVSLGISEMKSGMGLLSAKSHVRAAASGARQFYYCFEGSPADILTRIFEIDLALEIAESVLYDNFRLFPQKY